MRYNKEFEYVRRHKCVDNMHFNMTDLTITVIFNVDIPDYEITLSDFDSFYMFKLNFENYIEGEKNKNA